MQPAEIENTSSVVLLGLISRDSLAAQLGVTTRTLIRYEHAGMPCIAVKGLRLYDPAKVRAWLMSHERQPSAPAPRKPGRPTVQRAA